MTIRATYRLQFHRDFTFRDAEAVVPYLADLGISHLYASPITVAQPGSTHGYDVADPTRISDELGGEDGFRRLVATLRRHGMGAILDIVPNHMGIAGPANHWWMDVLEKGEASPHARFFDIDWREKLLLPFLGEPLREALAGGAIALAAGPTAGALRLTAHDAHVFPVRPEDCERLLGPSPTAETVDRILRHHDPATEEGRENLAALLDRQHYRLAWWRTGNDCLNWRRFFTITELAGLRVEDETVFEAAHILYFRLYAEGLIDGLRVDHVDGLTDPGGYCRRLRARLEDLEPRRPPEMRRGPAYLVVEKILAAGELLCRDWAVDGTSGYDFMAEAADILHAPGGEQPLGRHWAEVSGRPADFAPEEFEARRDMLAWEFEGQLRRCVEAFHTLARTAPETEALTAGMLRRAIERILWVFPVYRTYGTGADAPETDAVVRETVRQRAVPLAAPGEASVIDAVLAWLAGTGPGDRGLAADAVRRFQQLSAPIAAKAVEDTAFYRYGRLLSQNDVGFDPDRFTLSIAGFHAACTARRQHFPIAMLTTATHDHKRGEDVSARLAVLTEVPEAWIERSKTWRDTTAPLAEGFDPGDLYQLLQMLVGCWPGDLAPDDAEGLSQLRERMGSWQQKALREAKLRSSWAAPDEAYEARARACLDALLDPARSPAFLSDLAAFVERIRPAGQANGLVQTVLRCTAPGVPDLYQGTEFEDLTLVDPDNRRPVDFEARRRTLSQEAPATYDARKQALIAAVLRLRRENPDLWDGGDYTPVETAGPRAAHVLAFLRQRGGRALLVAACLHCAEQTTGTGRLVPEAGWWGDTALDLPQEFSRAAARDVLHGEGTSATSHLARDLFSDLPVHVALLDTGTQA
ncbi:MAG: malto-oligosyltrehalose synthase [Alphaproteobacteria bacterium]|nr:malto-oligosyltrehalose synthase [Alphaproteobacteria bacterium]